MVTSPSRGLPCRWWGVIALLLMWIALPQSTSAHATLLGTTPTDGANVDSAPTEVVLTFSENVGLVDGGMALFGTDIEKVQLEPRVSGSEVTIPIETELPDGNYVVQWRVVSADSHVLSGAVSFSVGAGSDSAVTVDELPTWVDSARTLAGAAKYLGLLAAAGLLLVVRLVDRRDLTAALSRVRPAILLAIVGLVAELPFAAFEQLGRITANVSDLIGAIGNLDSTTITTATVGVALCIIALASIMSRRAVPVTTIALVGALLTQVLVGHTRTKEPTWLMWIADAVHLGAAAAWLGGIVLLVLGLTGRWRGEAFKDAERSTTSVSRFSSLAAVLSALVAISGVVMGITILRSWDAFWNTSYGNSLLLKIAAVVVIIAFAAGNRFVFIPRLPTLNAMSWLRRLVVVELIVMIAVGGITAHLVQQDPNLVAEASAVTVYEGESQFGDEHTLKLSIVRNETSQLEIIATVVDGSGRPVELEQDLTLAWYQPEQELGPITLSLALDPADGSYRGTGSIPITGTWQVTVRGQIDRFTDSRTTIEVLVPD